MAGGVFSAVPLPGRHQGQQPGEREHEEGSSARRKRSHSPPFLSLPVSGFSLCRAVSLGSGPAQGQHPPASLSLQAVNIIPLTPMSLVAPEEAEKKENPLFSRKGEILASRKDFRMNTCTPHATGAFLLELTGLSPTHLPERRHEGSPSRAAGTGGSGRGGTLGCSSACQPPAKPPASPAGPLISERPQSRGGSFLAPRRAEGPGRGAAAPSRHLGGGQAALGATCHPVPLAPEPDRAAELGLSPGRPFLVPHGLDCVVGGKRKRKGPRKFQDFMKWFSAACEYPSGSIQARQRSPGPPLCTDLEALYWKQLKERVAVERKLQSQRGGCCHSPPQMPLPHPSVPLSVLGSVPLSPQSGRGWPVTLCPPAGPCDLDYEELVRRNVDLFIANSQKYAQETELSQHVRRWEERMGPLLQEQEERATFDIHGYGDTLAGSCGALGQWRSFASLVAGKPPFEVCRYMLAALQLANDYVVELAQAPGLEQALDTMQLRLLTHRRAQDRFHTFQPPSACS
uniref:Condensin-2 complex subunit H2 n=1 Tax=Strix occidentalis caurina TaxID=311401 RepID=A0A8D0KWJ3_STROC